MKPDANQEQPIVLSLGTGGNLAEIAALLAFRPQHKVIAIDRGEGNTGPALESYLSSGAETAARIVQQVSGLALTAEAIDFGRLELVIPGDYSDPDILKGRKAGEMICLYPRLADKNTGAALAAAFRHHLKPGGKFYMVTESATKFDEVFTALQTVGIAFDRDHTRAPDRGGVTGRSVATGNNGLSIPFTSIIEVGIVYDMMGVKITETTDNDRTL